MRAMVLTRCGPVEKAPLSLEQRAVPQPGAGEVRVRVQACGVCRTDLHIVEGELEAVRLPIVPGHQVVGRVDAVGPGVTLVAKGDRVGVAWLRGVCGECGFCRSGRENLCESAQFTGLHVRPDRDLGRHLQELLRILPRVRRHAAERALPEQVTRVLQRRDRAHVNAGQGQRAAPLERLQSRGNELSGRRKENRPMELDRRRVGGAAHPGRA